MHPACTLSGRPWCQTPTAGTLQTCSQLKQFYISCIQHMNSIPCWKVTIVTVTIIIIISVALQSLTDLGRLITNRRFLDLFRHMVGLLGGVISPSQGLYLHRTTQHRKTRDKHPCLGRVSNPRSQQPTGQDPRLRPHGHCDRHNSI
jgi:hypothetical protein